MLELGHRATIRDQVTAEGFTHDWCVFVRGPDKYDVDAFIDKVVFQLHESFPKPKRGENRSASGRYGYISLLASSS